MLKSSVFSFLLLALPATAAAQSVQGLYISGGTGVNFTDTMLSSGGSTQIDTAPGALGLGAVGWGFGNGLRIELEGSYRPNAIDGISTYRINGQLLPLSNVDGDVDTSAIMVNLAYDLPLQPFGLPVQPYVGVGLGHAWLDFGGSGGNGFAKFALPDHNTFNGPDFVSFGSSSALAYQAIAGASLPLDILPDLNLTLEYRFLGTTRADIPVSRVAAGSITVNGAVPSSHTHNGFEVHNNAVVFGLRYAFGTL
jgi:opacity protein-like surface antigen